MISSSRPISLSHRELEREREREREEQRERARERERASVRAREREIHRGRERGGCGVDREKAFFLKDGPEGSQTCAGL